MSGLGVELRLRDPRAVEVVANNYLGFPPPICLVDPELPLDFIVTITSPPFSFSTFIPSIQYVLDEKQSGRS
jgi:hypothetical protein